jgi:hypothetical protein
MLCKRVAAGVLLIALLRAAPLVAQEPAWLPRYDLDIRLDVAGHRAEVQQRVTWTNPCDRPAQELVFNAHAHYRVPKADVPLLAKTLEILRLTPADALDPVPEGPLQVRRVTLGDVDLPFAYESPRLGLDDPKSEPPPCDETASALVVKLPGPIGPGQTVVVTLTFDIRLPQKQGRWGQWMGVTFLSNWIPVVAVYDALHGWQPTPFIPWHQPFFNEAGIYTARVTLPCDQKIACSAAVAETKDLGNGLKQIDFAPRTLRDFAFLCSARFEEYCEQVGRVTVHSVALPEHAYYAHAMAHWACEAIPVYEHWIGPYPYTDFTFVESYFGWNGNECSGLVMIDERVFDMPHIAGPFVEYLISHELCHQWWYNVIGTNGYCETWMDEAMATHLAHRLMDQKHGRNNLLLEYPRGLEWLPNIPRDTYRYYSYFGAMGRGDAGPCVQPMPKYHHLVNLLAMCYDRGSKIVGMIEDRLGEAAFLDFTRLIYRHYYFRILRVADYQNELAAYTGQPAFWADFFRRWLYDKGTTDWCVEEVRLTPLKETVSGPPVALTGPRACRPPKAYRVTVVVHQKAENNDATVLGFCLDGGTGYQVRVPIDPHIARLDLDDPPAHVEALSENRVRVEVVLPCKPTQISVDPDQVLVDCDPANNHWKQPCHFRFTFVHTMLEETDVTNAYDRWNVTIGPGFIAPSYPDPWFTRSTVAGLRGDLYKTQFFDGGVYTGYREDYNDLVAGVDGLWTHWPWHSTQIGFTVEQSLTGVNGDRDRHGDRGVVYGRYVFLWGSSLYLPPMHYIEAFGAVQDDNLPLPRAQLPGADHFDHQTQLGLHYHLDFLTPYWDPDAGFRMDATYAAGLPIFGEERPYNRANAEFSYVTHLPDCLGPLSQTRLAARIYGGIAEPNNAELYPLGGAALFRGFDLQERQGNIVWVGSLEWRVPLAQHLTWDCVDHIVGLRSIYLAPFYDMGNAYLEKQELGPFAQAVGAGIGIDVSWFSVIERTTLRFDVAKAINSNAPVQFWIGVRAPF